MVKISIICSPITQTFFQSLSHKLGDVMCLSPRLKRIISFGRPWNG